VAAAQAETPGAQQPVAAALVALRETEQPCQFCGIPVKNAHRTRHFLCAFME
jgi:hypothetical protein